MEEGVRRTTSLSAKITVVVCCLQWPQNWSANYTVRDTTTCDGEDEKPQMFTIEHLQWLVTPEVWLLLLKCVPESIRGIIRVVRANYNMAIMWLYNVAP